MATATTQNVPDSEDLYQMLGLDEERRKYLAGLHELGKQTTCEPQYIFPLSQNSSVPPLGGPYIAKLERHPR